MARRSTYDTEGPDFVWAALQARAARARIGKTTVPITPLPPEYADIESFFTVFTDHTIPKEVVKDAYPDHFLAVTWYTSAYPSSPRWYLEALLLTEESLQDIAALVAPSAPVLAIDVYKRAFFNITPEKKNNPGWMRQYLWGPASARTNALYYHDFILKMAGFLEGAELLNQLVKPGALSDKASNWLKYTAQDQRLRMVLTSGGAYGKLSPELKMTVAETVHKDWVDKGTGREDELGSAAMQQLMDAVQSSIGVTKTEEELPSQYEFTSKMYDDEPEIKDDLENEQQDVDER